MQTPTFTPNELERFFNAVPMIENKDLALRNQVLFSLMYLYGIKNSEIELQRLSDVDFKKKEMIIIRSNRQYSNRVPLHPELCQKLKEYVNLRIDQSDHLFYSIRTDGYTPPGALNRITIYYHFVQACKRAHIPKYKRRLSCLRRTIIQQLRQWEFPDGFISQHIGR